MSTANSPATTTSEAPASPILHLTMPKDKGRVRATAHPSNPGEFILLDMEGTVETNHLRNTIHKATKTKVVQIYRLAPI